eukprot:TRINITY_DN10696_c0_g1_i2.p1 TRINITY_DN10696_c0_g1~~TRINITY_DN10696_c0_g1_i2.p1  ORF type:complete len:742 (+),score=197.11 TRINITY_DN10696_c0_g1_i2:96-2321(+)
MSAALDLDWGAYTFHKDVLAERNALWTIQLHLEDVAFSVTDHLDQPVSQHSAAQLFLFNGCVLLADARELLFMPMDLAGICLEETDTYQLTLVYGDYMLEIQTAQSSRLEKALEDALTKHLKAHNVLERDPLMADALERAGSCLSGDYEPAFNIARMSRPSQSSILSDVVDPTLLSQVEEELQQEQSQEDSGTGDYDNFTLSDAEDNDEDDNNDEDAFGDAVGSDDGTQAKKQSIEAGTRPSKPRRVSAFDYAQQAAAELRDLDHADNSDDNDGDTFNLAWSSAALQSDAQSPLKRKSRTRAARRQRPSEMHEVDVNGDKMKLQFRNGRVELMSGTHRHLLDYLTSLHVRGVLYQSQDHMSKSVDTPTSRWHERRVGVQDMLTETADTQFEAVFLLCFRMFMSPLELMAALKQRFNHPSMDQTDTNNRESSQNVQHASRLKNLAVLYHWITAYWSDFNLNKELLADLKSFLPTIQIQGFMSYAAKIEEEIQAQEAQWQEDLQAKFSQLQLQAMPKAQHRVFDSCAGQVLGEQLTLFDLTLFRNVLAVEYVNHLKRRPDTATMTAHLDVLIARFNQESQWVVQLIQAETTSEAQAAVICKIVDMIQHCDRLNNFFSLFSLLGGLSFGEVAQYKAAWKKVPKKAIKVIRKYEKTILDPSRNMAKYRERLAQCSDQAAVPFVAVLLKDMLFFDQANIDRVDTMINFDKLRQLYIWLQDVRRLVRRKVDIKVDDTIQTYLACTCK